MKKMTAALAMLLGIAATAGASTVKYDYDREADFSLWKRFAWKVPAEPGSSMTESRIRKAVGEGFEDKGYLLVEAADRADFLIVCRAATWTDVQATGVVRGPLLRRSVYVDRVPKGTLFVEVFDRKTGKVAWHGSVSDDLASNPESADRKTEKAVAALLKKFPARAEVQP